MRKTNTTKFEDKLPQSPPLPKVPTLEEALEEALAEAASSNVEPSAIMKTFDGGHVNGLGEVFEGNGMAARPQPSMAINGTQGSRKTAGYTVVESAPGQAANE